MILKITRGVLCTPFLYFLPLRTMSSSNLGVWVIDLVSYVLIMYACLGLWMVYLGNWVL